jgi:lipoic acid synthetase
MIESDTSQEQPTSTDRKPPWLKVTLPSRQDFWDTKHLVDGKRLYTVCEEAHCPNRYECWSKKTATFMIAGDRCTRACGFCAVKTAKPFPLDPDEPQHVAEAIATMDLDHAVITMVTRDDLPDGAATHFANVIRAIRKASPKTIIEVLASDLNEKETSLKILLDAYPHIFGHNLETVERLTPIVRFRAQYQRSLRVLQKAYELSNGLITTKSGIMLGLGETHDEILKAMDDLLAHQVSVLTLGQYLRPSKNHLPVVRFVHPDEFANYERIAKEKGFRHVASGPLVRSSYHAADFRPDQVTIDKINQTAVNSEI